MRAFASLARTRNFSRTAELLHLVQSTISVRIRALEDELGKPLFERGKRRVELTPAGHALVAYADRILSLCEEGRNEARLAGEFAGRLAVGATDSVWRYLMRPVLTDFVRANPRVVVATKTARSAQVLQMLSDGLVGLGFGYSRPRLPGLVSFPVYEDEVVLIAHPSHPSARLKRVTKQELPTLPLLYCDWDGPILAWVRSVVPPAYLPPLFPDQLSILVTLVLEGAGAAFVPRFAVREELASGKLKALPTGAELAPPPRVVYGVVKRGDHERPEIAGWIEAMRARGFRVAGRRRSMPRA